VRVTGRKPQNPPHPSVIANVTDVGNVCLDPGYSNTSYRSLVPGEQSDSSCVLLNRACRIAGLDSESARLVRIGSNAVYRLSASVIVRISRIGVDVDGARRTVAVARWLESVGYPSVRAIDVDQPIVIDGRAVTFWQAVSDNEDEYASVGEVAQVLVDLHRLVAPADLNLPSLEPFDKAAHRIEANDWLSSRDRDFLIETLVEMRESYGELDFVLPQGVIHGDANVGNVLHDSSGNPVVIDLDGFSIGPREWDLALTAIYYDSFGWHTREEYETFVRVYGFDIMKWPGYPVMRAVREFLMVSWVIQKAGESPRVEAEARNRISALRTGASRKDWVPY
jgi:aminoglycoside phosphotransferase (APT) family kinase protein